MSDERIDGVQDAISTFYLSTRGAVNFTAGNPWSSIEEALDNPWSPDNPNGTIVMRLAENSLMHDTISEHIRQRLDVERVQHLTYGRGPRGSLRLRKAVAELYNSDFGARETVTYQQVIVMSGVTAVTDALVWSICDEGDGILIPQPFYTGYHIDVSQRARGVIIAVPFQGTPGYTSFGDALDSPEVVRRAFEAKLDCTRKEGGRVKAVLITKYPALVYQPRLAGSSRLAADIEHSPHNPLGRCYPEETIKEIAKFCAANNLHLISNEIYARSVFDAEQAAKRAAFRSILSLGLDGIIDPHLVHVLYGASKDFCANGLRLGVLQTRNKGVLEAVASLSPFSWPPYMIQDVWAGMLEDEDFRSNFTQRNHDLMSKSYHLATCLLAKNKIPYYKESYAGLFLWIDLRRYILDDAGIQNGLLLRKAAHPTQYEEREAFIDQTCMKHGVSIARGSIFGAEESGWFRLTFTISEEEITQGIQRLVEALEEVRRKHWGALTGKT